MPFGKSLRLGHRRPVAVPPASRLFAEAPRFARRDEHGQRGYEELFPDLTNKILDLAGGPRRVHALGGGGGGGARVQLREDESAFRLGESVRHSDHGQPFQPRGTVS